MTMLISLSNGEDFNESGMELKEIGVSEASSWDTMYVKNLEKELKNCYQEIEYLQDQLNLRNLDAIFMADNVQSLELKLAGAEKLNDKLKLISEELMRADSQCLILVRKLKHKEEELGKSDLHIEDLEALILDSQCEIESLKLDITALDQRYGEAERLIQQLAEEKDRMTKQLGIFKNQLQEKQQVISNLENEKKVLQERLMLFDRNAKQASLDVEFDIVKKLAAVTSSDEHVNNEIEKMAKQVHESELLIKQLKEELKEVKFKAKEEAEDLTQEMAELRYQFTVMLEEESKRRGLVEEASIRRVQDLEAQVKNEQKKYTTALSQFEKVNELAEKKSLEIMKLKRALENLHLGTNLESSQRNGSCFCGYYNIRPTALDIEAHVDVEALDAICAKKELNHALTECYHGEVSTHDVQKDKKVTKKDLK